MSTLNLPLPTGFSDDNDPLEGTYHFFQGAHHFQVGTLNVGTFANPSANASLLPILDASHARNRRASPPDSNCLAGTRRNILEGIRSWVEDEDFTRSSHVLWLCGPVGCGKSAISQTVSEDFAAKGRLLGSFFFFRGSGERSRISRLAVTLASQMATVFPEVAPLVAAALSKSLGLQRASTTTQFQQLFWDPLEAVLFGNAGKRRKGSVAKRVQQAIGISRPPRKPQGPFLIIIDGLDECEDRDDVGEFIDQLLDFFKVNPHFPLRFLIASRVEEHIRDRIETDGVRLENLRDHLPDEDIFRLVRHTFKGASEHNRVIRSLGETWPSTDDLRLLIQHADGSFIFIRTLLSFILGLGAAQGDGMTPMDRFKLALGMNPGLDDLYTKTLQRAQHIPHFQDVILTIALLARPLSISLLSQLLGIPQPGIVNVLIPLQSIVHVPGDDDTNVTLFHTSLREFLLDDQRGAQLLPPGALQRWKDRLAYRCLQNALELDIHDNMLSYAERYWARHWRDLDSQRIEQHYDFLSALTRRHLQEPAREMASATFHCRSHGTLTDTDLSQCRCNFGANAYLRDDTWPQSRIDDVLLQAFAYLATINTKAPKTIVPCVVGEGLWSSRGSAQVSLQQSIPRPRFYRCDTSVHRSVVVHAMEVMTDILEPTDEGGWLRQLRRPSAAPLDYDYLFKHWAFHLASAIADSTTSEDRATLAEFLQRRYQVSKLQNGASEYNRVYRARRNILDPNVDSAVAALYNEFPHLLAEKLGHEAEPGLYVVDNPDGLTVVDMLKVFWQLRLSDDPHHTECVKVLVGGGTVLKMMCSWREVNGKPTLRIRTRLFSTNEPGRLGPARPEQLDITRLA